MRLSCVFFKINLLTYPLFGPCLLWLRSPISATAELLFNVHVLSFGVMNDDNGDGLLSLCCTCTSGCEGVLYAQKLASIYMLVMAMHTV